MAATLKIVSSNLTEHSITNIIKKSIEKLGIYYKMLYIIYLIMRNTLEHTRLQLQPETPLAPDGIVLLCM